MRFIYSVIQFVPEPLRGEFVNVGLILGSEETKEWAVQRVKNERRARYLEAEEGSTIAIAAFESYVGRTIDEYERSSREFVGPTVTPSEEWLNVLRADYRGVVQVSEPLYCAAPSFDDALDLLSRQFLVDPFEQRRRYTKQQTVYAALRRAYLLLEPEHVRERVRVETTKGAHQADMDFAVLNGSVLQLSKAWSFQVADTEWLRTDVRAWAYSVQQMKREGATALMGDRGSHAVGKDVEIEVVYAPADDERAASIRDVMSTLRELKVGQRRLGDEGAVAKRAAALLRGR